MTANITFGYVLIGLAIPYFAFKVYVSYETEGGAIGMTPVLDGAIFPPTMVLFGLGCVLHPPNPTAPQSLLDWLLFGLTWLGSVVLAGLTIVWAGKLCEKRRNRRQD